MSFPQEFIDRLSAAGQSHLVAYAETLEGRIRDAFIEDLRAVDLVELARLLDADEQASSSQDSDDIRPLDAITKGEDLEQDLKARRVGEQLLRDGRVAVFLVAGGQGTRLGHAGPKGTFKATPISRKPLFQVFAEKLIACGRTAGRDIPLLVMTGPANHAATVEDFEANQNYGLKSEQVRFIEQGTMPAVDGQGKLILAEMGRLFRSPDGHGGALRILRRSGALDDMLRSGVEHIFYFQVDNPLVVMCDPVFLGYHALRDSDFSSKAVPKRDPAEKVGVLVRKGGAAGVIEYSDLPADLREARDDRGELVYRAGNIAVHALKRSFVESVTEEGFSLPFHRAHKKIESVDLSGNPQEIDGIKFEAFVFDALSLAQNALVLEVDRSQEFSPVKNEEGADSPATCNHDQIRQHAGWLEAAGMSIPRDAEGEPTVKVEISPLFADSAERLLKRAGEIPLEVTEDLLLEGE